jgi:hypothetical protein
VVVVGSAGSQSLPQRSKRSEAETNLIEIALRMKTSKATGKKVSRTSVVVFTIGQIPGIASEKFSARVLGMPAWCCRDADINEGIFRKLPEKSVTGVDVTRVMAAIQRVAFALPKVGGYFVGFHVSASLGEVRRYFEDKKLTVLALEQTRPEIKTEDVSNVVVPTVRKAKRSRGETLRSFFRIEISGRHTGSAMRWHSMVLPDLKSVEVALIEEFSDVQRRCFNVIDLPMENGNIVVEVYDQNVCVQRADLREALTLVVDGHTVTWPDSKQLAKDGRVDELIELLDAATSVTLRFDWNALSIPTLSATPLKKNESAVFDSDVGVISHPRGWQGNWNDWSLKKLVVTDG